MNDKPGPNDMQPGPGEWVDLVKWRTAASSFGDPDHDADEQYDFLLCGYEAMRREGWSDYTVRRLVDEAHDAFRRNHGVSRITDAQVNDIIFGHDDTYHDERWRFTDQFSPSSWRDAIA